MKKQFLFAIAFVLLVVVSCKEKEDTDLSHQSNEETIHLNLTLIESMSYNRIANEYFKIVKHYKITAGRGTPSTMRSETLGIIKTDKNGVLNYIYKSNKNESGYIEIVNSSYRFSNIGVLNATIAKQYFNDTIGLVNVHLKNQTATVKDTLFIADKANGVKIYPYAKIVDGYVFTTSRYKTYGEKDTIVFALGWNNFAAAMDKQSKGVAHNNQVAFEVRGWPFEEIVLLKF